MSNQVNFYITKEKEKELFSYINNECDCKIYLLYKCGEKEVFEIGDEICDDSYFIKSDLITQDVRYEKDEDGVMIQPFDEEVNFYPFVSYERIFQDKSDEVIYVRLYISKNIKKAYRLLLKSTYKKVSEWVIKKSVKKERDGLMKFYYVE